ncbi:hypothetical protein MRX96_036706 [Rhipicephalus microplus]
MLVISENKKGSTGSGFHLLKTAKIAASATATPITALTQKDAAPADQSGQSGSDTDDKDETQEPSTSSARSFLWKRVNHARTCQPQWEDSLPDPPDEPKAPIEYFRYFFDDKLLSEIRDQSNLYAVQKNANKALRLTSMQCRRMPTKHYA